MKKRVLALAIMIGILGFIYSPAFAYLIDGKLDDWNINLLVDAAKYMNYLDNNLPSGGLDIDVVHEDNTAFNQGMKNVGPGYSTGNIFDAEAIYFDNDQFNAYIAVVTGLPIGGGRSFPMAPLYHPGDIAIDIPKDNLYDGVRELGIDINSYNASTKKAKLYYNLTNANWQMVAYSIYEEPYAYQIIDNGSLSWKWIDFVYSDAQNTHYVMEGKIPLSDFGVTANPGDPVRYTGIQWTMECNNDKLAIAADINPVPIPEPGTLSLLGLGLVGLLGLKKRSEVI